MEQVIDAGSVSDAQDALKRALEAVHELADCLQRNEWVQADWAPDELGLWHAHIGARNAAHHTSSAVAVLHSDVGRDERLIWDMQDQAIASLRSQRQACNYASRLAGRPVLPHLRAISNCINAAVEYYGALQI